MGKRHITQRRGRGNPRYRSPSHRYKGSVKYPRIDYKGRISGQVIEFDHDPGRTAPVAKVLLEDFTTVQLIAPETVTVGQTIEFGSGASVSNGNVLPLKNISPGTGVFNLEVKPGDGGKIVRSSGSFALIVSHDKSTGLTQVKLPSKKTKFINSDSLATVGRVGGGGRKDKPMLHAGQMYYRKKAKGKLWPVVCGRAMNAVDHKHGGGRHPHVGRPTTVSRNAPPGRKVGHIAAKRTGKKKRG
ncbi:MAG: 50S ribosomal protein L2 [Candidatus Altiarchaeales archaeon]|nr:50S ribosomal protein L2 [Candidatus Altiarchaeales archaeon]MBD3416337.1 50S ribosomal protein L2 [Candidatus Altiarchaeales archaeon]